MTSSAARSICSRRSPASRDPPPFSLISGLLHLVAKTDPSLAVLSAIVAASRLNVQSTFGGPFMATKATTAAKAANAAKAAAGKGRQAGPGRPAPGATQGEGRAERPIGER